MEAYGFAVSWIIRDLFWQVKRFKFVCGGGRWCQVSGVIFCALVIIEEIKSPCGGRSFGWDKIGVKGVSIKKGLKKVLRSSR